MKARANSNRLISFEMRLITFPLRPSYTADFDRFNVCGEEAKIADFFFLVNQLTEKIYRFTLRYTKPEQPSRILAPVSKMYNRNGWNVTTDTADENTIPAQYQ